MTDQDVAHLRSLTALTRLRLLPSDGADHGVPNDITDATAGFAPSLFTAFTP